MKDTIKKLSVAFMALFSVQSMAVEISLTPSKASVVTPEEGAILKSIIFERKRFTPNNDNDIRKIILDNKMLANAFIESKDFDKQAKLRLEVSVNEMLAKQYVKTIQAKISISDDIAKSYYYDHIDNFKYGPMAKLDIYTFPKLDDAFSTYERVRSKGPDEVRKMLEAKGVKSRPYNGALKFMYPEIRNALRNSKDQNYFTPPQYHDGGFILIYVKEMNASENIVPFEKVKKSILLDLRKKTYLKMREEAIKQHEKQ